MKCFAFVPTLPVGGHRPNIGQRTEFNGILREDAWGLPIIVDGEKEFIEIVRVERSAARDVSPLDVASMP